MKVQRTFSVKKYLRWFLLVVVLLFGVFSLVYSGVTAYLSVQSDLSEFSHSLENYMTSLSLNLHAQSDFNRTIVSSNPNFALLSFSGSSEVKRLVPLHNLRQIITYHDNAYCVNMLYDSEKNEAYYSPSLFPLEADRKSLTAAYHQIGETMFEASAISDQWYYEKVVDDNYLILQNKKGRIGLCTLFSLQKYTNQYPIPSPTTNSIVSVFTEDQIISAKEPLQARNIDLPDLQDGLNNSNHALHNGNLVVSYFLEEYKIGVSVVTPLSEFAFFAFERFLPTTVILLLMVLIFVIVYTLSTRFLLMPVLKISDFSKEIEKTHDYSISKPSRIKEVQETQQALVSLAKTISELEKDRRAEKEEKSHALLQYYQLQTKSHFFINCLKSLYGMLENRQIDRMKLMIIAFSNHLRYVFHDNLFTVPLSFELQEVEDYYQILSLDSGKIFLLDLDVDENLENCSVPPLIIQSFLENSFKYNDGKKGMIVFSVKVSTTVEEDKSYLCIHMQDNGCGYPREVLESINRPVKYSFEDNHIGINNLKRRLSILYGENYSFAFYNLPAGGACSILSIPLTQNEGNDL